MNPIEWLCTKTRGFDQLTKEELDEIMHFVLLWSFFEANVFNETTRVCAQSIIDVAEHWKCEELVEEETFKLCLSYFKKRYIDHVGFTGYFDNLKFRANDNRPLVEAVLKGNDKGAGEKVAAILIIVYRLRNNLFHGLKWEYDIRGELSNFKCANSLLMTVLETHGNDLCSLKK